jgi:hypothetical protein
MGRPPWDGFGGRLRNLDFDDMMILRLLMRGERIHSIARQLFVTDGAIFNKLRKMRFVFGDDITRVTKGFRYLTLRGIEAAIRADQLLNRMEVFYGLWQKRRKENPR